MCEAWLSLNQNRAASRQMARSEILEKYLPDVDLGRELDKSARTIKRWRTKGIGPPSIMIGNQQYTHVDDARDWLEELRLHAKSVGSARAR